MLSSQGHRTFKISEIRIESPRVKRIVVEGRIGAKPGQYVMIWVPKIGEIPVSIARERNNETWFLISKVGKVSSAIHSLSEGDKLWIRGPYGNGFSLNVRGKVALIGGGYGIAPLIFLAENLKSRDVKIRFYAGFREKEEVLMEDLLRELSDELILSTNDGSHGLRGLITEHVDFDWPDHIYTAGPERMLVNVVRRGVQRGKDVEASLERLIRCAVGLCGACSLDPLGLLVCKDGPVFKGKILVNTRDFGNYKRSFDGRKIPLEAHY